MARWLRGDISAFRQAGGKLIIYHGWGDPLVTPQPTVEFYEAPRRVWRDRRSTGVHPPFYGTRHGSLRHWHRWSRHYDTGIDPLTALEQWVEEGKAPDHLIATKTRSARRPDALEATLCAYPKVARYSGSGDVSDAASFTCAEP